MERMNIQLFNDDHVEQPQDTPPEQNGGDGKKFNPTDVLRKLSKDYSVNLFEEGGYEKLTEKLHETTTKLESANVKLNEYAGKEQLFAEKEQEYQVRIDVLRSGLDESRLEEVVALAKVNGSNIQEGLKIVKEKYGNIFSSNVNIGTQHNDFNKEKPPVNLTEQDKYMQQSPAVKQWNKLNQKN